MGGVTYDTGALLAADRGERRLWARHARLLAAGIIPTVPAPVVAEAWRGTARHANLARLLATSDVEDLTDEQARRVGLLARRSGHGEVVDLTVVEGAVRRNDLVITSDASDLRVIASVASAHLEIESI